LTDERAIAAAAMIGDSDRPKIEQSTPTATGAPAALSTTAEKWLCRMSLIVARLC
jgi:hypothetical protein